MTPPDAAAPLAAGAPIDRQLLNEIFARPEFAHASTAVAARTRSWPERVAAWFDALMRSDAAFSAVTWTRAFVLSAVFLAAVWLVVRALQRRARREPEPGEEPTASGPRLLGAPGRILEDARARVTGAPREAVRVGSVAALLWLARHNLCRADKSHTNQETLAELTRRGAPAEVINAAAAIFDWYDRAFYSLNPISQAEAEQFLGRVESLGQNLEGHAS